MALFVALIMIITVSIPGFVFAASDPGLESAIKSAKQMFDIPEDYNNFSYSVRTEGDTKIWDLNWSSKSDNGSSIQITIDNTGDILNYYNYKNTNYENIKKLPAISKSAAQTKAEETVKKLNPDIFSSLKPMENSQSMSINESCYSFGYERTYNGIPFPQNGISIYIDKQTGEVQNYNKTWIKNITFPSSEKAISLKEAQEAYIKNLGLRLTYQTSTDEGSLKVFGAYVPVYNSSYYIDALTGERVNLEQYYYGGRYGDEKLKYNVAFSTTAGDIILTPEEIEAVEEVSKLISQENAEKIARELKILELDETFTLQSASLFKGWSGIKGYQWELYFTKSNDKDYRNVNVAIDATTGEITSFYTGYPSSEDSTPKYDKDAAKKAVEEFLKQFQANKFKETQYEEINNYPGTYPADYKPTNFWFKYERTVNGIPVPENNISVEFDAISGKITNYGLAWFDTKFPSLDNAVAIDDIYEIFFKDIGLKLQYTTGNSDIIYTKESGQNATVQKEAKLVYTVNPDKPSSLDALTGVILDSYGKPYEEKKQLEYTDISGHYAQKEIELLAQAGIGLEGPELKPNEQIKQKDFLLLISQVISNGYRFYGKTTLANTDETEDLYKLLIQEGIIKENEKNPEGSLTREDSVKFVVRALKYEKVAALSDIFNCKFKDKNEISPDLIGHVVIAKGLKIINGHGDYFRPKAKLKKADALIIIYNYLQI